MLQRNELLGEIEKYLKRNVAAKDWQKKTASSVNRIRKMPIETAVSILTQRTSIRDYDDFTLFCIAEGIGINRDMSYYFSEAELDSFRNRLYEEHEVAFPYKFMNMIEISEGSQYIGKITVQELMRLRDAQLINYNENAQRTLKDYAISLNRKAVNDIMKMLSTNSFVPNTLTLNISPDAYFVYNKESKTLTIKEKIKFDILDGYHRYVALSNMYNLNSKFDYPMELRIVAFPENRARHFIFQEDQKTKMRKIDSDALSGTDPANEICAKIRTKLAGNITVARNNGTVDESVLSEMIRILCIRSDKRYDNMAKNSLRDVFVDAVLKAQDEYSVDLKEKWSVSFTVAFCLLAFTGEMSEERLIGIDKKIRTGKMITGRTVNRTIVNRIRKEVLV